MLKLTVLNVSNNAAIYCFTIVAGAVLVGTVKNVYAAIYVSSAPVVVILALVVFGFPGSMVLIDQMVLIVIDLVLLRYMWRVITICRVYKLLPHRAPENKTRRRLF